MAAAPRFARHRRPRLHPLLCAEPGQYPEPRPVHPGNPHRVEQHGRARLSGRHLLFQRDLDIESLDFDFPARSTSSDPSAIVNQRQDAKAWGIFGSVNYAFDSGLTLQAGAGTMTRRSWSPIDCSTSARSSSAAARFRNHDQGRRQRPDLGPERDPGDQPGHQRLCPRRQGLSRPGDPGPHPVRLAT